MSFPVGLASFNFNNMLALLFQMIKYDKNNIIWGNKEEPFDFLNGLPVKGNSSCGNIFFDEILTTIMAITPL